MMRILAFPRYDYPHCFYAEKLISERRPRALVTELPGSFQRTVDSFLSGKLSEKAFLEKFSRLSGMRGRGSEKGFAGIIVAAKKAKVARVSCAGLTFDEAIPLFEREILAGKADRAKILARARAALQSPDPGFLAFFEFVHAPFHFLELLLGHFPERDGARHSALCKICRAGVSWERFFSSIYAISSNLLHPLPEGKYVYALHAFDKVLSQRVAKRAIEASHALSGSGYEGFVLIHLWHEKSVESELGKHNAPFSRGV